jgi:hypothetical protein
MITGFIMAEQQYDFDYDQGICKTNKGVQDEK